MPASYYVGTAKHVDYMRDRMKSSLGLLQREGRQARCHEYNRGEFTFFGFCTEEEAGVCREQIAEVVADTVVQCWENDLLAQSIRDSYYFLNNQERLAVEQKVLDILKDKDKGNLRQRGGRKEQIKKKALAFLEEETLVDLVMEGFIVFRLQEYMEELEDAVNEAIDEFLMEKEYDDFIRLLRYFVDMQEPRVEMVHVVLRPSGAFQLFDGEEKVIKEDALDGCTLDVADSDINFEDVLISSLITIAPGKIILHAKDVQKLRSAVATIAGVFGEKVVHCTGCQKCAYPNQRQY